MQLRRYLFFYGWFIAIYLALLLVGGIGWIITKGDSYMSLVFIGLVYYHIGSYFIDVIPVPVPPPIPPLDTI